MRASFGRSTKYNKPLTERVPVLFTEDHLPALAELAAQSGSKDVSSWLRAVALGEIPHPDAPHPADVGSEFMGLKFLTKAPCGDWKEAVDFADDYTLSPDIADTLEARDGDVVVQADGDSMEGARIFDGDLVLMRPLQDGRRPGRGEIALVQIIREDGACDGMIKRWKKSDPVELEDGAGNAVPLPDDVREIKAVAVARGLIARLI